MERLVADFKHELLAAIEHCERKEGGEKTASDFTHSELSGDDLDKIMQEFE